MQDETSLPYYFTFLSVHVYMLTYTKIPPHWHSVTVQYSHKYFITVQYLYLSTDIQPNWHFTTSLMSLPLPLSFSCSHLSQLLSEYIKIKFG